MIRLSNGHKFKWLVASGALGFDGKGWPWERPLVWLRLIEPRLFTVVLKTLTLEPRAGNLRWWKPWGCVRLIPGGAVNKVGLTNPGIVYWVKYIGPTLDYKKYSLVGSIYGTTDELVVGARMMNQFDFVALEINVSCPNTEHKTQETEMVVDSVQRVKAVSRHPILVKVSTDQDYLGIAQGLVGYAEAIDLNSVRWELVYPYAKSPLHKLEKRVGGGGGGVSGIPAHQHNWQAVAKLAKQKALQVIGPGVMELDHILQLKRLGADAISFGSIHLRTPWKPTSIVRKLEGR